MTGQPTPREQGMTIRSVTVDVDRAMPGRCLRGGSVGCDQDPHPNAEHDPQERFGGDHRGHQLDIRQCSASRLDRTRRTPGLQGADAILKLPTYVAAATSSSTGTSTSTRSGTEATIPAGSTTPSQPLPDVLRAEPRLFRTAHRRCFDWSRAARTPSWLGRPPLDGGRCSTGLRRRSGQRRSRIPSERLSCRTGGSSSLGQGLSA